MEINEEETNEGEKKSIYAELATKRVSYCHLSLADRRAERFIVGKVKALRRVLMGGFSLPGP